MVEPRAARAPASGSLRGVALVEPRTRIPGTPRGHGGAPRTPVAAAMPRAQVLTVAPARPLSPSRLMWWPTPTSQSPHPSSVFAAEP